jgi:hypothetical protein
MLHNMDCCLAPWHIHCSRLHFCMDCRKPNVTKKDCFPLSWIDETLDKLVGAKWSSTLNMKSNYWQVDLHLDDKKTNATDVPFGSGMLQRLMETILQVMACVAGWYDHSKSTHTTYGKLPWGPPDIQYGKAPTFSEECTVPTASEGIITDPKEAESHTWMVDSEDQTRY